MLFLGCSLLESRELGMKYDELTVSLCRLFDEISLLRKYGTRAGSEGDLMLCDSGSRASGTVIYITVVD